MTFEFTSITNRRTDCDALHAYSHRSAYIPREKPGKIPKETRGFLDMHAVCWICTQFGGSWRQRLKIHSVLRVKPSKCGAK